MRALFSCLFLIVSLAVAALVPAVMAQPVTPAGGLDTTWGGGLQKVAFPGYSATPTDAVVAGDGSVFLMGTASPYDVPGVSAMAVVKFRAGALLPNAFGSRLVNPGSTAVSGRAIALQADGKVLLAGHRGTEFLVMRLLADGTVDPSFGDAASGYAGICTVGANAIVKDMAVQGDGSVLVVGSTGTDPAEIKLVRFSSAGLLDAGFGVAGVAGLPAISSSRVPTGVEVLADGQIQVTGLQVYSRALMARFDAEGALDTTFGTNGVRVSATVHHGYSNFTAVTAVLPEPSGAALVLGHDPYNGSTVVAKLTPDWQLDPAFADAGRFEFQKGYDLTTGGMIKRAAGGIFVSAGYSEAMKLMRFRPDGELDTRFGEDGNGTASSPQLPGSLLGGNRVTGLAELPDGRLVVFGSAPVPEGTGGLQPHFFVCAVFDPGPDDAMPWLVSSPDAYSGPLNEVHTFRVEVYGRPPFTYQWQKDDVDFGPPVTTNSMTDSLPVLATRENAGHYRVIVSCADGSVTTETAAMNTFPAPPMILSQPQGVMTWKFPEGEARVSMQVRSERPLSLQMWKNGKPFVPKRWEDGMGANGEVSIWWPLNVASDGVYRCMVRNANGGVMTDEFRVLVANPGTIWQKTPRQLLQEGEALKLEIFYFAWMPQGYQWQFNGKDVAGQTSDHFDRAAVTLAHAGSYQMAMKLLLGGTASSDVATVAVVEKGRRKVVVASGKPASLKLKTAGEGLYYHWRHSDGSALPGTGYEGVTTATLKILQPSSAGGPVSYACEVRRSGCTRVVTADEIEVEVVDFRPVVAEATGALPPGAVGRQYEHAIETQFEPSKFTVSGLPAGLVCDVETGVIRGTPRVSGEFKVRVSASNPAGTSPVKVLSLHVAALEPGARGVSCGPLDWLAGGRELHGTFSVSIGSDGAYSGKLFFTFDSGRLHAVPFKGQWQTGLNAAAGTLDSTASAVAMPVPDWAGGPGPGVLSLRWEGGQLGLNLRYTNALAADQAVTARSYRRGWDARTNPLTPRALYYTAVLTAQAPVPAFPASGNLSADVDPGPDASGHGYLAFTVGTGGTLTVTGRLPDGMALTVPAFVTESGKVWVHAWLHGYRGLLSGEMAVGYGTEPGFYDSVVAGELRWRRPASSARVPAGAGPVTNTYFDGVDRTFAVAGMRYLPPRVPGVSGPLMLDLDAVSVLTPVPVTVRLTGGDTREVLAAEATLTARHEAVFPRFGGPVFPEALVQFQPLVFDAATGVFSGTATEHVFDASGTQVTGRVTHSFRGIVARLDPWSRHGVGAGYFTHTQDLRWTKLLTSGAVRIEVKE